MQGNKGEKGKLGENLAAAYFQALGWTILARNYHTRWGEVDIIAQEGNALVFIEVKLRRSQIYGTGYEAINPAKQRRIAKAALQYLQENGGLERPVRFDAFIIQSRPGMGPQQEHIRNAFQCPEEIVY